MSLSQQRTVGVQQPGTTSRSSSVPFAGGYSVDIKQGCVFLILAEGGCGVCVCGPEHPREFSGAAGRTCKDIKSGKLHTRRIQGDNELHVKANWEQATAETSDKTKCRLRPHMNCLGDHLFCVLQRIWEVREGSKLWGTVPLHFSRRERGFELMFSLFC